MDGTTVAVSSAVYVDILTPALSYPATLSRPEIIANCQRDLCLGIDECLFYDIDNDRIGCLLKNNRFTMEYVERQYQLYTILTDRLERAGEALKTFQDQMTQDQELIGSLKSQLEELRMSRQPPEEMKLLLQEQERKISVSPPPAADPSPPSPPPASSTLPTQAVPAPVPALPVMIMSNGCDNGHCEWKTKYEEEVATRRNLQEKLHKIKRSFLANHNNGSNSNNNHSEANATDGSTEPHPRAKVPKLPLTRNPPASPTPALRSKSSSELLIMDVPSPLSTTTTTSSPLHIHTMGHEDYVGGGFSLLEDKSHPNPNRRRNTIAHMKPLSDPPLDIPPDALSQCRLCHCDVFRPTQKAGWICLCGHTSIKHSNIAYKEEGVKSVVALTPGAPVNKAVVLHRRWGSGSGVLK